MQETRSTPAPHENPMAFGKWRLSKLGISNMSAGDRLGHLPYDVERKWVDFVRSFKSSGKETKS